LTEAKYKEWRKEQEAEFKKKDALFQEQRKELSQQLAESKAGRLEDEKLFNARIETMQREFKASLDEERAKQVADENKLAAMTNQIAQLEKEGKRLKLEALGFGSGSVSGSGSGSGSGSAASSTGSDSSAATKKGKKRKAEDAGATTTKSVRQKLNERFSRPDNGIRKSDRARQSRDLLTYPVKV
jgi:hypothetical protein